MRSSTPRPALLELGQVPGQYPGTVVEPRERSDNLRDGEAILDEHLGVAPEVSAVSTGQLVGRSPGGRLRSKADLEPLGWEVGDRGGGALPGGGVDDGPGGVGPLVDDGATDGPCH